MPSPIILKAPRNEVGPAPQVYQTQGDTSGLGGEIEGRQKVQMGEGLTKASDQVDAYVQDQYKAALTLQARDDSIKRSRDLHVLEDKLNRAKMAADINGLNDPDTLAALRQQYEAASQEAISNHRGSPASLGTFTTMVEDARFRFDQEAVQGSIKAGHELINQDAQRFVASRVPLVAADPGALPQVQLEIANYFRSQYAPGMTEAETQAASAAAFESTAVAAINSYTARGDYEAADHLLRDPLVGAYLSTDKAITLASQIGIARGEQAKTQAKIDTQLSMYKSLGIDVGKDPRLAAAVISGVSLAAAPRTLDDEVHEFERVMTHVKGVQYTATADDVRQIAKFKDEKGGIFKDEDANSAWRLGQVIQSGTASPEQISAFLSLGSSLVQPAPFTDQKRDLPFFYSDILQNVLGISPATFGNSTSRDTMFQQAIEHYHGARTEAPPLSAPTRPTTAQPADTSTQIMPEGPTTASGAPAYSPDAANGLRTAIKSHGNLFNMADNITGPIPWVKDVVASVPYLGAAFPNAETVTGKQFAALVPSLIVSSIRTTDRFADAERVDLRDNLKRIMASAMSEPTSMRNALIGVDDFLAAKQANLEAELEKPLQSVTAEKQGEIRDLIFDLQNARTFLGVPPLIQNVEAGFDYIVANDLKAGDWIRGPNGFVKLSAEAIQRAHNRGKGGSSAGSSNSGQ